MIKSVLITDCFSRKTLSAVRSLGEKGLKVHIVTHKRLSPAAYSSYVNKSFFLSNPVSNRDKYREELISLIKTNNYDCVMPMDTETITIILDKMDELKNFTSIPFASKEIFDKANDKWKTYQLSCQLNIPVPKSFLPKTKEELDNILKQLNFPVIIKPRSSFGSRGVFKANNTKEFEKYYETIKSRYGLPIIQEYINKEGQGMGVGILCDNGNILASFSYKRLREFPINGGPSTLRESTNNELIKDYAALILKKLNYHGVAMVEFKHDLNDNLPKLLEINPRFWGSLELAHISGINFPFLLFQLSQNEIPKIQTYKKQMRCRWLLPGDILHFLTNPKRFSLKPSFFNFFDKNTFYDQLSSKDKKGSIAAVLCTCLSIFDIETWRLGIFRK